MQAYHQQLANLNLPNGTPGLLIASPSQFANMQQQQQQQQQYHLQPSSYQELVKAYLPQLNMSTSGLASLSTSPASSSPSSSLSSSSSSSMASFAVKLMSLNAHEMKCLNSDNELMRHIHEAQVLIDNRLHDINSKSGASHTRQMKQQLHQQQSSPNQLNLGLAQQQQQEQQQQQHLHLQNQQHILMSPDNYYQNYYAQQLAFNQMAQLQHHRQQQLLSMDSGFNFGNLKPAELHVNDSRNDISQQLNNLTTLTLASSALKSDESGRNMERINSNQLQQISVPALDLRTTPTRPISDTPSPTSMRNSSGNTESAKNSRQQPQQQHLKKTKLVDYKKKQQSPDRINEEGAQASKSSSTHEQEHAQQNDSIKTQSNQTKKTATPIVSNENFPEQTDSKRSQNSPQLPNKRVKLEDEHHQDLATLNLNIANTRSSRTQINQNGELTISGNNGTATVPTAKKHKGEFDEPSPSEVAERERHLSRPDHYHCQALKKGTCACIIGSEFTTKTPREALEQLEQWRSLDIEQRIKWKWDLNDLPKDIPLSDIKKFEDLRRDYSNGRADFGGASKRKPLGIRGTRQFLLMLYCLWGHPGRDDRMQQDGYCPHCFAKIRTENEQSTLVRVVNHFNMKHRRGANPRLSPETRAATQTPQDQLICETLKSVVETAVASTEN